jgi:hypothetical protein
LAVPVAESGDVLGIEVVPAVSPDVTVAPALEPDAASAAAAEPPAGVPLAVPLVVPVAVLPVAPLAEPLVPATPVGPRGLPPLSVFVVPAVVRAPEPPTPPAPAPAPAVDAAAAAVEAAGGETLPDAGNCPPLDPLPCSLLVAGLRAADLLAALVSADAKSLPSVL